MYYTIEQLRAKFAELGYKWPAFHLIGVRSKNYVTNAFCDTFYLVAGDKLTFYAATTRPGSYYLLHLINPKGAAILKPGQYLDKWVLGLHRGKYEAWIQAGPVTVFRDNNLNNVPEEVGVLDTGYFGIDIHRASAFNLTKLVDNYSAGCQVFADVENFAIFVALSKASGQKTFSYTLLEEF